MRIVSLIPSATEIVAALGHADWLVGRSHECDFPQGVMPLPILTRPKIRLGGSSLEIHREVESLLRQTLSVYEVDEARLKQLKPEVILTQSQCEVCAVSLKDVEAATCSWLESRPAIVPLEPNALDDVWADIGRVADALNDREGGRNLLAQLQQRVGHLQQLARLERTRPTTVCIEWIEPLMTAGNWMPELVTLAGGLNLLSEAGKHSPWTGWESIRRADPEIIVILPCGFSMAQTRRDLPILASLPGWNDLRAVKEGRVAIADGHHFFNRPGPRLVESLEILMEIIHPDRFRFGHEGLNWALLNH